MSGDEEYEVREVNVGSGAVGRNGGGSVTQSELQHVDPHITPCHNQKVMPFLARESGILRRCGACL